jgi:hypothetical protein
MWMSNATLAEAKPDQEARVADWAAQISEGDFKSVQARFAKFGAAGPVLTWRPTADDVGPLPLKFLLSYWTRLKGERALPDAAQIDPLEMRPALGHINLLDVVDDGRDFRFRLFGTAVVAATEVDLTGDLLSETPGSAFLVEYELALHRAAYRLGAPAATSYTPPASLSPATWNMLLLPFANQSGAIIRILTGVVAVAMPRRADA